MSRIDLIATSTFGLESVVAREVRDLGYQDVNVENARVTFTGDEEAICRANLWLRSADRVLVKMGEFKALSFEELFQQTKALPWADWLPENANFPVEGKSIKSTLHSVPDCQAIVKKAIVEKLKQSYKRDWFPENGPRYTIEVALLKDKVTLTLDTSGAGLHKRGYRTLGSQAPLKETLASAMVQLSYWEPGRTLIDPFCGSGTIPIEAALIGLNIAPGLRRQFAAEKWPAIPAALWQKAREEAQELADLDRPLHILGSDIDSKVLGLARFHARQAGVEGKVFFQKLPAAELRSSKLYGCVICNPPYGERMGDTSEVEQICRDLGNSLKQMDTWSYYVLSALPGFEHIFGKKADRKRKLYNGRIECHYYQFYGPRPPRPRSSEEPTASQ